MKLSFLSNPSLLLFIITLVCFMWIGVTSLDSDLGWHLKLGEIILQHGIPQRDPFSYTMPSYPFVDYEWGSNVLLWLVYQTLGKVPVALIYALLALGASIIAIPRRLFKFGAIPWLLLFSSLIPYMGIRLQVESWLLIALLLRLLFSQVLWHRFRWFYPLLMFLWVNLHGSFPIGIVLVVAVIGVRMLKKRKLIVSDVLVLLLGVGATLINPYGVRDWLEVIKQMSDIGFLHQTISEWKPIIVSPNIGFLGLLTLAMLFGVRYKAQILERGLLIAIGTLVIMGFVSVRHIPFAALSLAPIVARGLQSLEDEAKKYTRGKERLKVFSYIVLGVGVIFFSVQVFFVVQFEKTRAEEQFYPVKAVDFLQRHQVSGNIFAPYEYGGYLIWKLSGHKFFVDGRMSNFFWKAPFGESDSAFREYTKFMHGEIGIGEFIHKYNISVVLWGKHLKDPQEREVHGKIVSFDQDLQHLGWNVIFEDTTSRVWTKK